MYTYNIRSGKCIYSLHAQMYRSVPVQMRLIINILKSYYLKALLT